MISRYSIRPTPGLAAMDPGPVQDPRDRARRWRVYLPRLGIFRYRLEQLRRGDSAPPLVACERGTAFDGWVTEDREKVRLAVLRAHGVRS